jgi:hypothetical protein
MPKRQQVNDSEDNSDSSIGSDSSMSIEAAPRALIWRNDNHLEEGQEGIPPSERVNYPLREKVQTPIREEGQ